MPEGDTIRRLADKIDRRFAGQRVERCVTRDPRLVGLDLTGRALLGADAVGKHLLIRFDDGRTLHAHLLMTGSWRVGPAATEKPWRRRLELWLGDGRLTAIDVPLFDVVATGDEPALVGHLGPDLCGPAPPDLATIGANMRRAPDEPLGGSMLDQRNAAGWGNLYANELPFIVGISPFQPVGSIDGLDTLVDIGAALIRTNAQRGPQNTTGRRLATDDHWIYKRAAPCPLCATRLRHATEAEVPWRRVTTWCPSCQPPRDRATVDVPRARRLLALHPARRAMSV